MGPWGDCGGRCCCSGSRSIADGIGALVVDDSDGNGNCNDGNNGAVNSVDGDGKGGGGGAAAAVGPSREFCDDGLADPDDNTSFSCSCCSIPSSPSSVNYKKQTNNQKN